MSGAGLYVEVINFIKKESMLDISDYICSDAEYVTHEPLFPNKELALCFIFSAKESIFKALNNNIEAPLNFRDIELFLSSDNKAKICIKRLCEKPANQNYILGYQLQVRGESLECVTYFVEKTSRE